MGASETGILGSGCGKDSARLVGLRYNKKKGGNMPVRAVRSAGGKIIGYRWGSTGKIYKTKAEAEEQGRAIRASGWKES